MDDVTSAIDFLPKRKLARANGPLYRQLADILRAPIANGSLPIGRDLPKEASIAERYGVSLITVRQALRDLEADGLIKKRPAKPAVVAARSPSMNLSFNFQSFTDIAAIAENAKLKIKSYRKETVPALQRSLGLREDEVGYCLRSILSAGGQKKAQVTAYFPPDIGAKLKRKDFSDPLIFRSVQNHFGLRLVVAHVTIRAEIADATLAADLDIAVGSPILAVEMLYQSADRRSIEFSIARHPTHLFSITYDAHNDMP